MTNEVRNQELLKLIDEFPAAFVLPDEAPAAVQTVDVESSEVKPELKPQTSSEPKLQPSSRSFSSAYVSCLKAVNRLKASPDALQAAEEILWSLVDEQTDEVWSAQPIVNSADKTDFSLELPKDEVIAPSQGCRGGSCDIGDH